MLDTHSNQTRLQNTLLVQVQKRVDVEEIALGVNFSIRDCLLFVPTV